MEQKQNNHLSLNQQQKVKIIQFTCDNVQIYWHFNTWHDNAIKVIVLLTLLGDEE